MPCTDSRVGHAVCSHTVEHPLVRMRIQRLFARPATPHMAHSPSGAPLMSLPTALARQVILQSFLPLTTLTTHYLLLTTDHLLLTTCYWLLTTYYSILTTYLLLLTAYYLLLTTYYLLLTTYYLPAITCYLPLTTY